MEFFMAKVSYTRLSQRERALIAKLKVQKKGVTEIARRLGRDKSTISRELRRNATVQTAHDRFFLLRVHNLWTEEQLDEYLKTQPPEARTTFSVWRSCDAQAAADTRASAAQAKRRRKRPETRRWVIERLRDNWSPQQIAGRSAIDGPESVSHEYVYRLICADKKRGGGLYRLLKRFGKRKQRLGERTYPPAGREPNRVSIDERPAIVDQRKRLGDYEADLIVGYRQSGYVLSVIDRVSRAIVLRRLETKRMDEVCAQLVNALKELGHALTVTTDNGTEFNAHKQLSEQTGVSVFFTHPYCSTERGSIENANGLVRYYLPKRSSFARVTQLRLDKIAALLNHRPRQCLGYLTPHEVHFKKMSLRTLRRVALVS